MTWCTVPWTDWQTAAYGHLVEFVRLARAEGKTFTVEEVRIFATERGLRRLTDERVWGGLILYAKKCGLVEHAGIDQATMRHANKRLVHAWRSL